jgi:hypothetical protein
VLGTVQGDANRDGSARRRRAAAPEWARRALEAWLAARASGSAGVKQWREQVQELDRHMYER